MDLETLSEMKYGSAATLTTENNEYSVIITDVDQSKDSVTVVIE